MSEPITVSYFLTTTGQKDALRKGKRGDRLQTITIPHGDENYPLAVDLARQVYRNHTLVWEVENPKYEWDYLPTATDVLNTKFEEIMLEQQKEKEKKAKEAEELKQKVIKLLNAPIEECVEKSWNRYKGITSSAWSDPLLATKSKEVDEWCKKKNEELDNEARLEEEEKKAKADAFNREMRNWASLHGSERLRRCIQEGIACRGIYRRERLKKEFHNFVFEDDLSGYLKDPVNPPEEAFKLLDEARLALDDAYLQYYSDGDIGVFCAVACWPPRPDDLIVYFGDQKYLPESNEDSVY